MSIRLPPGLRSTFRTLTIRNYRLFLTGQTVSQSGRWAQQLATGWLVLEITGSAAAVGVAIGVQRLPTVLGGLWAGTVADRLDKRRILVATQAAAGLLVLTFGVLTAMGAVRLSMIYAFVFLVGCADAIEIPARLSFVAEIVGDEEITNAMALNSASLHGARILGPGAAGLLIPTVGIAWVLILSATSVLAVITGLLSMDPDSLQRGKPLGRASGQIREGLRVLWGSPDLRWTAAAVAIIVSFAVQWPVVLPALARFEFGGGVSTFALLTAMMAVGSLVGALVTAWHGRVSPRLIGFTGAGIGGANILAAIMPTLAAEAATLLLVGALTIPYMAMSHATMQLGAPAGFRGRVSAIYAMVAFSGGLVGAPVIGWISQAHGPRIALFVGGAFAIVAGLGGYSARARAVARGGVRPAEGPVVTLPGPVDYPTTTPSRDEPPSPATSR